MKALPVLLLVMVAGASAQPVLEVPDAEGDVVFDFEGQPLTGAPDGTYYAADLLALRVLENRLRDGFDFILQVKSLQPQTMGTDPDTAYIDVRFSVEGVEYDVYFAWSPSAEPGATPYHEAILFEYEDPESEFRTALIPLEHTVDVASGVVTIFVPREAIPGADGLSLQPGGKLEVLWVDAMTKQLTSYCCNAGGTILETRGRDRLPDQGTLEVVMVYGIRDNPKIRLWSDQLVRASNGGTTTLVYLVNVTNHDDQAATLQVEVDAAPDWHVDLPVTEISVASGSTITVPVFVTATFRHTHGETETATVSFDDGRQVAEIDLGVHYLDTPQPTGHHDTLWLHNLQRPGSGTLEEATYLLLSNELRYRPIMNAREDDPRATDAPIVAEGGYVAALDPEAEWEWRIPLDPALAMGLEFNTASLGAFEATIRSMYPTAEAELTGDVLWIRGDEERVLATLNPVILDSLDLDDEIDISTTVIPAPSHAVTPFERSSNLELRVRLIASQPQGPGSIGPENSPQILPGAWLRLPLHEYHDPLVGAGPGSAFSMEVEEPRLSVAPGKRVETQITITNGSPGDEEVTLDVLGPQAAWAVIERKVTVPAGSNASVPLFIEAPEDALDGSQISMVVSGRGDGGYSFATVFVRIDQAAEGLEGEGSQGPSKKSSLSPVLVLGSLAACLAWTHGRRRG